jgi:transcriptional regulator GlxA family with amidase domain
MALSPAVFPMKNISILVPETAVMEGVAAPRYLFTAVNQFFENIGKPPFFKVQLVGATKEIRLNNGLFSIHPDKLLEEVEATDLVFIPPLSGDLKMAIAMNQALVPWILRQYQQGAEIASLCLGAFLLADTGLLKGRQCSTHWAFANEFRTMFPDVDLVDGSILTESQGVYSSGGANSYWNLLLYLVEKFTNRETAILAAKYFAIDIDRNSQAAFSVFQGQKDHNDLEILQTQAFIEQHFFDKITIDELAESVAIGRRSFERRFKKATNNSVLEYIQRVKIEAAKRNFESSRKNIGEVMMEVGYTDTKAFRDVFKKLTGLTPIEYRNKYNKA